MSGALMVKIGKRIRALREMHEVTQVELAPIIGLTRTSISNVETGRQNIQIGTLEAVAKHFGVSLAALLGEADLPLLPKVTIATTCAVRCEQCGLLGMELTAQQATADRREHIQKHLASS